MRKVLQQVQYILLPKEMIALVVIQMEIEPLRFRYRQTGVVRYVDGTGSTDSILRHIEFRYGGYYSGNYMLYVNNSSPVISDNVFRDVYSTAVYLRTTPYDITFSGNDIQDGTLGLYVTSSGPGLPSLDVTGNSFASATGMNIDWLNGGSLLVSNNTISNANATGIILKNAGSITDRAAVTDNTVTGGSNCLSMNTGYDYLSGNTLSGSDIKLETTGTIDVSYGSNAIDWTSGNQGIAVSGTISQDTVWSMTNNLGRPYVVTGNVTVNTGSTLRIEPGTIVKFRRSGLRLIINGILDAQGTPTSPIYFTSERDDSVGGDTNGDRTATVPVSSDWGGVYVDGTGSTDSILRHIEFRYGGYYSGNYMLYVNNSSPVISDNVFRDVYSTAVYLRTTPYDITFSGNDIQDGTLGLYVTASGSGLPSLDVTGNSFASATGMNIDWLNGGSLLVSNNTISNANATGIILKNAGSITDRAAVTDNTVTGGSNCLSMNTGYYYLSGNTLSGSDIKLETTGTIDVSYGSNAIDWTSGNQGIAVSGTISQDTVWSMTNNLGRLYVVTGNVTVNTGSTLRIEPGTIVKFRRSGLRLIINGILDAQGTPTSPIYFTSERDDSVGGDTNGDRTATVPVSSDWGWCVCRWNW